MKYSGHKLLDKHRLRRLHDFIGQDVWFNRIYFVEDLRISRFRPGFSDKGRERMYLIRSDNREKNLKQFDEIVILEVLVYALYPAISKNSI